MLVGNFKATWNHQTQAGKITLVGVTPPSLQPGTIVVENLNASEMSLFLAILRVNEPIEYSNGVLSMRDEKVIPLT